MTNKIDSVNIVREREHDRQNEVKPSSNADYVKNLDKTSSIMPPQKPFEKGVAEDNSNVKEQESGNKSHSIVQHSKDVIFNIEQSDKTSDTKLFLLSKEYEKISMLLNSGNMSQKEKAEVQILLKLLEDKIILYKSKQRSGGGSPPRVMAKQWFEDIDINNLGTDVSLDLLTSQYDKLALFLQRGNMSEEETAEKSEFLESLKNKIAFLGGKRDKKDQNEEEGQ